MAAKTFTNAAGGTWDVAGNWTPAGVPGTTDDAFINMPGTYTVTMDNTQSVNSIVLNDADATLDVTSSGVVLANTVTLDAGTFELAGDVIGGTIVSAGGVFAPNSATLDGVTWQGPLIGASGGGFYTFNIKDGITLEGAGGVGPGTLDIASDYMVSVLDATTLDNLTIQFDDFNAEYLNGSSALALNLGANVLVTQTIAGSGGQITGLKLNNLGTIDLSASHGSFLVESSTFDNAGTFVVSGDSATASSNFTNTGVVSVIASGVLTIGSNGTSSNDSTIAVTTAGTLIVSGSLGGTGAITVASHGVAEVHNLGGPFIFEDNKGTLDLESPSTFTGVIGGFQGNKSGSAADKIDLIAQPANGTIFTGSTSLGTLTVLNGVTPVASLLLAGNYTTEKFSIGPDGGTGTDITVACFAAGTRILTAAGEVAVQALRVGDVLPVLLAHRTARVRWIGHRRIDCRRHPRPAHVWPVRVCAGAFGDTPHRDLWLSPDHAVFAAGKLIPIRCLVNGTTIAQVETPEVTYWHLELDRHEVVLAEGLPAETYLDTANRDCFDSAGGAVRLHPEFDPASVWEAAGCAPLVVTGPELDRVRQRLTRIA